MTAFRCKLLVDFFKLVFMPKRYVKQLIHRCRSKSLKKIADERWRNQQAIECLQDFLRETLQVSEGQNWKKLSPWQSLAEDLEKDIVIFAPSFNSLVGPLAKVEDYLTSSASLTLPLTEIKRKWIEYHLWWIDKEATYASSTDAEAHGAYYSIMQQRATELIEKNLDMLTLQDIQVIENKVGYIGRFNKACHKTDKKPNNVVNLSHYHETNDLYL